VIRIQLRGEGLCERIVVSWEVDSTLGVHFEKVPLEPLELADLTDTILIEEEEEKENVEFERVRGRFLMIAV